MLCDIPNSISKEYEVEYEEEYEEDIKKGYIKGFAWTRKFMGKIISNGVRGNEIKCRL
jgi:hypothetical protein